MPPTPTLDTEFSCSRCCSFWTNKRTVPAGAARSC